MNREQAIKILSAKQNCMKRQASGIDADCNNEKCEMCILCYEQGTARERIEAVGVAIEALRKQNSKYYELGKKIMEDVQNALLYGTKGKKGDGE